MLFYLCILPPLSRPQTHPPPSSDVHFWHTGRIGDLEVQSQHCLGHEGSGEIVWTGSAVAHLKPGDRVAIEPGVPCGKCFECSSGHYNLCLDVKFSGVPPHTGSMRRYHVHPADYLHKMPDNLTYADGALLEPLSVALRGFERGPLKLGEAGVVFGAGPIGLISLAVAKAAGLVLWLSLFWIVGGWILRRGLCLGLWACRSI